MRVFSNIRLSQKELADRLHTSQQQISRLQSPGYEGHSLSMLRRVANALGARVQVYFEPPATSGAYAFAAQATPSKTRKPQRQMK